MYLNILEHYNVFKLTSQCTKLEHCSIQNIIRNVHQTAPLSNLKHASPSENKDMFAVVGVGKHVHRQGRGEPEGLAGLFLAAGGPLGQVEEVEVGGALGLARDVHNRVDGRIGPWQKMFRCCKCVIYFYSTDFFF